MHTMLPKLFHTCGLLLALFTLAACESVTSTTAVGEQPAALVAEDWEGNWYDPQKLIHLTVTDASQGRIRLSYDDDGEQRKMNLVLRTAGNWMFINVLQAEVDDENAAQPDSDQRWYWGRVVNKGDRMLLWSPSPAAFVAAIQRGDLPGEVKEKSALLGQLDSAHLAFITSDRGWLLMEWDEPTVLFRTLPEELTGAESRQPPPTEPATDPEP